MGKKAEKLSTEQISWIKEQKMFFVGTAAAEGRVNISPKGMDTFRIIDESSIAWLNLTGSGNETAAHMLQNNRMTIMFCAFEGQPKILRLYGKAKCHNVYDSGAVQYLDLFDHPAGARQIFELNIDLVQTSCGFGVPLMEFREERDTLKKWAESKGSSGIQEYWKEKNPLSIDGFPTGL